MSARRAMVALAALFAGAVAAGASPPATSPALAEVARARLLRGAGDERAAAEAIERALALDPACALAWLERGLLVEATRTSALARRGARNDLAHAFALDPALADPTRYPELRGSRLALAAMLESWKEPASAVAVAPSAAAATPRAHPAGAKPATSAALVLDAGDLVASGPVNQVLPAGSGGGATARRGGRAQRFRPPPTPVEETPYAPVVDEPPAPEEGSDASGEEPPPEASGEEPTEEPPPAAY